VNTNTDFNKENNELCESFRKLLKLDKEEVKNLDYIVGYKGFRQGVRSGNYYGKNFREISLNSINTEKMKQN